MNGSTQVILVVLMIVGAVRCCSDRLDRARIREHVSKYGGKIIEISWSPFGSGWPAVTNARLYTVRYGMRGGEIVTATCATSIWSDVHWLRESPPDSSEPKSIQAAPAVSAEEIKRSATVAAEPISCLQCGKKIPELEAGCPNCGWSYQTQ